MKTINHFTLFLLCTLLSVAATFAQTANPISQDVTIIIQADQVRFTSQKAVQMMQLQIFNQAGEQVYDSGPMSVPDINWPLQNANGEALKSGLYAYKLSIQESGAAEARVRRGHFIVDRAQDRDGKTDKLWVTSQKESSIGTELTVARNESSTVAGTSSERATTTERDATQRDVAGRGETASTTKTAKAATEAASGTVGQIAKFITATDLGNSVITEKNGNVGIGTATPESPLHVHGASGIISSGSGGAFFFRNRETTTATDYWGWYSQGNIARFWRQGVGDLFSVTTNGNVGIGTTTPQSKLTVQGGGYGLTHTAGAVTLGSFITTAAGGSAGLGTKSNHPLNFFTNDGLPRMTIDTNGNVGIGISPTTKLHVLNTTPGTSAIYGESASGPGVFGKSTGSRGVYGESTSNTGVWGKSTSSHGVFGQSESMYGVYGFSTKNHGVYGESASLEGVGGYFRNTGGGNALRVEGRASIGVLEVTGGSDLAEKFRVEDETKPGMVVAIDPKSAGRLALSRKAYNRRVAGIISGANNLSVGMVLPDLADAKNSQPIALSGRVWVYCDATSSAIQPGDLLTTSATPGHAMKVVNQARAQGAILGKAMTSLKTGKGMVLVLVTLQ